MVPSTPHGLPGRRITPLLLLLAGALAALGSSKTTPPPRERLIDEPDPQARRRAVPPPAAALPYPACPAPPGAIARVQLHRILDRGPGVFLGGVEVTMTRASDLPEAARRAWPALAPRTGATQGFGGWRLGSFHPGDPCLTRTGLRRGDVVVSVNGNTLRRPGDLVSLWAGLRRAPHLVVRLIRQDEPLTYVVRVVDPAPRP